MNIRRVLLDVDKAIQHSEILDIDLDALFSVIESTRAVVFVARYVELRVAPDPGWPTAEPARTGRLDISGSCPRRQRARADQDL